MEIFCELGDYNVSMSRVNRVIVGKKPAKSAAARQKIPEKISRKPITAAIARISDKRRECLQKVL